MIKRGVLRSFDAINYTATVQLTGSDKVFLSGITVARNIASGEMITGRELAVVFFNETNSREAAVIAVFTPV